MPGVAERLAAHLGSDLGSDGRGDSGDDGVQRKTVAGREVQTAPLALVEGCGYGNGALSTGGDEPLLPGLELDEVVVGEGASDLVLEDVDGTANGSDEIVVLAPHFQLSYLRPVGCLRLRCDRGESVATLLYRIGLREAGVGGSESEEEIESPRGAGSDGSEVVAEAGAVGGKPDLRSEAGLAFRETDEWAILVRQCLRWCPVSASETQ